jgi:hypothetical protein
MHRPSPRASRALLTVALAFAHLVVLAWQAPHLVHHALEPHAAVPDECVLSTAADHAPASIALPVLDVPIDRGTSLAAAPEVQRRTARVPAAPSRAPPSVLA